MKSKGILCLFLLTAFAAAFLTACRKSEKTKKKIVYVNSYHQGHPSSDEIMNAVAESFPADSFDLTTFLMDTKRNTSTAFIEEKAATLADSIDRIDPDVLIVSDDNAVKYLVQPYIVGRDLPVVFCGVNWSDREYNLPPEQVTGMLEILPLADVLDVMRSYYPDKGNVLVLTENTTTARKEEQLLDTLFERTGFSADHQLVEDFASWKTAFEAGSSSHDLLYIPTNGGIKGWDHDEAVRFVAQHIRTPVVTCEDFMMPYVVFGMTKVAKEQGIWAAETARKILDGGSPEDFPVTRNRQAVSWLNASLAERIGFELDSLLLSEVRIVGK